MILWIVLFVLIVAISLALAIKSMKDYREIPPIEEYGLFLIRRSLGINQDFINELLSIVSARGIIVSLERLFKDKKSALTIFGPKNLLQSFLHQLELMELEDYALFLSDENTLVWQLGLKTREDVGDVGIFVDFPELSGNDQFFWQVVLGKGTSQIRAAVLSEDQARREMLAASLQNLGKEILHKIPSPYSNGQMIGFFKARSLSREDNTRALSPQEAMQLIKI